MRSSDAVSCKHFCAIFFHFLISTQIKILQNVKITIYLLIIGHCNKLNSNRQRLQKRSNVIDINVITKLKKFDMTFSQKHGQELDYSKLFYILRCYNEIYIVQGMKKSNLFCKIYQFIRYKKVHILIQTEFVPLQYILDPDNLCLSRAISIK